MRTAEQGGLQDDAADVQQQAAARGNGYSLSVDDVRSRLIAAGISKSKDSIQRYCREGDLDCQKQGMLRRYFATEKSITALIKKFRKDETARSGMKVHEAAGSGGDDDLQVHAGASDETAAENKDLHEAARSGTKVHAGATDSEIVSLLKSQLEDKDNEIGFLREELTDRRTAIKSLEQLVSAFDTSSKANLLAAENEQQRLKQERRGAGNLSSVEVIEPKPQAGEGDSADQREFADDV